MKIRGKFTVFLPLVFGASACSLFVSLDDLRAGGPNDAGPDVTTDATGSADGGANDAALDAPPDTGADAGAITFVDDFNRADNASLGNGWIEKNPSAFTLGGNMVVRGAADSFNYSDNIVYRPSSQDVGDVEVACELVFSSAVAGYPQVLARIQEGTVATSGVLDGYLFYIENSKVTAVISRTQGTGNLTDLATITLSPEIIVGDRYRLRFRVTGTAAVTLTGVVEHFVAGTWVSMGSATFVDSDPSRIVGAGSTGFSGSVDDTDPFHYDNFTIMPL